MTTTRQVVDAVSRRDASALEQALERDARAARARDETGQTALMNAIYSRFADGITLLLKHGALTSLHEAAALGDTTAVQEMAAADPQAIHAESPDGATPLHLAAHFGHLQAVAALLRLGADPHRCTRHGLTNTPLHAAAAGRRTECAALLLDAGADPNTPDGNGYTPLHIAAAAGSAELVTLLLEHDADPRREGAGKTPYQVALDRDEPDVARLLKGPDRRG